MVRVDEEFFALDPRITINNTDLYNDCVLYGMDFASCLPVRCLNIEKGNRILELCTAPGNKAMYMADILNVFRENNEKIENFDIIGVDANYNRCKVMESLVKKYGFEKQIQVLNVDGIHYEDENKFDRVLIDAECTH